MFISTHNVVIVPGERPSKYFFKILKSLQIKHGMSSLKNGAGKILTEQRDILKETINYYTNLCTAIDNQDKNELNVT